MTNFNFVEKGLRLVPPPHFVYIYIYIYIYVYIYIYMYIYIYWKNKYKSDFIDYSVEIQSSQQFVHEWLQWK